MKQKTLIVLGLGTLAFFACKKENNVAPSEKNALTINVVDSSKKAIPNSYINITHFVSQNYFLIINDSTGTDGVFNVEKLIEGDYLLKVSSKKGKKIYSDTKYFQVVADVQKTISINPFRNYGAIIVTAKDEESAVISDINVAVIPNYIYSSSYTLAQLKAKAWETVKTDSNGRAVFADLPAVTEDTYSFLFYKSTGEFDYPYGVISLSKGQTDSITQTVNLHQ